MNTETFLIRDKSVPTDPKRKAKEKISKREHAYAYAEELMIELGIETDARLQPRGSEAVSELNDYIERAMEGIDRAAAIDGRVNQNIADRCELLLNEQAGRISFRSVGDRYFEGQERGIQA